MIKAFAPGFWRRLLSMIYESLILIAVLFIASFIFHLVFQGHKLHPFPSCISALSSDDCGYLFHLVLDPWWTNTANANLETSRDQLGRAALIL